MIVDLGEMNGARAVECFVGRANGLTVQQDRLLIAVTARLIDRERQPFRGAEVFDAGQREADIVLVVVPVAGSDSRTSRASGR